MNSSSISSIFNRQQDMVSARITSLLAWTRIGVYLWKRKGKRKKKNWNQIVEQNDKSTLKNLDCNSLESAATSRSISVKKTRWCRIMWNTKGTLLLLDIKLNNICVNNICMIDDIIEVPFSVDSLSPILMSVQSVWLNGHLEEVKTSIFLMVVLGWRVFDFNWKEDSVHDTKL